MFYSRFASMDEDEDEDEDDAEAGGFEDTTVGGGGCLNDEGAPGLELQHNIWSRSTLASKQAPVQTTMS